MAKDLQSFSQAESQIRQEIFELIKKVLVKKFDLSLVPIEYPPEAKMGDYSVPCFLLSKKLNQSPAQIAKDLADQIQPTALIKKAIATGPYLNFSIDRASFSKLTLTEIAQAKDKYGQSKLGKGKKVMVEFFSPNTNKLLTIGHIRNICLGWSISQLLKFTGHHVITSSIYNDRGIAIAKTILGYQKWGQGQTPKSARLKPDHFVGQFYAKLVAQEKKDPNLAIQAQRVLRAWEEDKKDVKTAWQKLQAWVLDGFGQTLAKLGIDKFDEDYYESEFYQQGKELVEQGLKQGVFIQDKDGVTLAPLEEYGLPDKIVLRPDQTSLYITQDLYLAQLKNRHNLDASVYVVAAEQDLYFKQLFKILELLGFENADQYYHLSYGLVRLPDGRIKSREGVVEGTGADELIAKLEVLAQAEISQRDKDLSAKEISQRAQAIALAALKFYILAVNPKTTMVFDPKKSLSFTGQTGPYLQYVHARINSIFAKAKTKVSSRVDFSVLTGDDEFELVKLLARFPKVIDTAVKKYDPSELANYLYQLAKTFSGFYENVPVISADDKAKKARLLLISDVKIVLATGLDLLGISALEKM